MSCVNSSCCGEQGSDQPVSSSQAAVDAAQCATTGTNDTVNALIVHGSDTLAAVAGQVAATKQQAIRAQTQFAQTSVWASTLVIVAIIAGIAFVYFARARGRA